MLRIGVTQRVEDLAMRRERVDCLDQAWTTLLETIDGVVVPIPNRVENIARYLSELDLSGVILSGGNDLADLTGAARPAPERDACEHAILNFSAETRLPVLGVCRGLQIMARHHGASLTPVEGHVATRHAVRARDAGRLVLEDRESVNSFHRWGLRTQGLPEGLRVAATGADDTAEAIYHVRYQQAALMWHPERGERDPRDSQLIRAFFGSSP